MKSTPSSSSQNEIPWRVDVMSIYQDYFTGFVKNGVTAQAISQGKIQWNTHCIRDFSENPYGSVDDYPYGGGRGMVLSPPPLEKCLHSIPDWKNAKLIYPSPQGKLFNSKVAQELLDCSHLIFLCGRYEGVDERFLKSYVHMEVSIGDYILAGGESAVAVMVEAASRLIPGVLGNQESLLEESLENGLLEYPQYTRPPVWNEKGVPQILLSGHHGKIKNWRMEQSLKRTQEKRPDLWESYVENPEGN